MLEHQKRFLELALRKQALRFGDFELKSGRRSPYFFNAGHFDSGAALRELGACYAETVEQGGVEFDVLFGPAYKGIPLATALALALAERGRDVPVAFNRKETKAHGEGGVLIGAPLCGRVLIVDDVITAGTAIQESVRLIRAQGAEPVAVIVALDRQERGQNGERSATEEVRASLNLPVYAVARLAELVTYTELQPAMAEQRSRLLAYRANYGVGA